MKVFVFIFLFLSLGCSVKEAYAPGNPPTTNNKLFSASDFQGRYQTIIKPTLFLWPVERDGEPMTREEQVTARANIVALSEELEVLKTQINGKKIVIEQITRKFVEAQCGQYQHCEDDDFLCEVDPAATSVDEWKEPANDDEAAAIASCQDNQKERKRIKKKEIKPLSKEATKVTVQLGTEIGGENERSLNKFEAHISGDKITILLKGFEGFKFFLDSQESSELKSGNILFDKENGYLSFQVPAMKKNSNGEIVVFGDYSFKLEIGQPGDVIPLNGELKFFDNRTSEVRTGRVALTGTLIKD